MKSLLLTGQDVLSDMRGRSLTREMESELDVSRRENMFGSSTIVCDVTGS